MDVCWSDMTWTKRFDGEILEGSGPVTERMNGGYFAISSSFGLRCVITTAPTIFISCVIYHCSHYLSAAIFIWSALWQSWHYNGPIHNLIVGGPSNLTYARNISQAVVSGASDPWREVYSRLTLQSEPLYKAVNEFAAPSWLPIHL